MKLNALPKVEKCSSAGICSYLEASVTGHDGRHKGINSYRFFNPVTKEDFWKYTLVFRPRHKKDEYGQLAILFCPYCGAEFQDGRPK